MGMIKVVAKRTGQIRDGKRGIIKTKGTVFEVDEKKLASWMTPLDKGSPEPEPAEVAEPETLSDAKLNVDARIRGALESLDPEDDAHWTQAGDPAVEPLRDLTGLKDLTRAQIMVADPGFNRTLAAERLDV